MRDFLFALLALCLVLAASALDHHDLEDSSNPGIGCAGISAVCNSYFAWGDGVALPWIMTCIAWIESRWEPTARNPSGATGLWQIMEPLWCSACDCSTLETPDGNANCANVVLKSQGLNAWNPDPSTCENWLRSGGCPFSCSGVPQPDPSNVDFDALHRLFNGTHIHRKPLKQ